MKSNNKTTVIIEARSIIRLLIITSALLTIPLLAMLLEGLFLDSSSQESRNINWDALDFIAMGLLIFGTGLAYEFLKQKFSANSQRLFLAITLLLVFILIWAELSVGIFGTPFAGS